MIAGFPLCAIRDPDLSIEDLRVLICVCALADKSGRCREDIRLIAGQARLPEPAVTGRLDRLESRGYLSRQRQDGAPVLELASDAPTAAEAALSRGERRAGAAGPARRKAGRTAQASLHSGMLRRPRRRQAAAIEFDDAQELHPVVASLQDSVQGDLGGADGFRFWLRTILDPEDVEIFSGWACRQSVEYRELIGKFDNANDDNAIEALLEDTLALVDREKKPTH